MSNPAQIEQIYEPIAHEGAIRQGEILTELIQYKLKPESLGSDELEFISLAHRFVIVVSQDCDLDWNYKSISDPRLQSKALPNILFAEVVTAHELRNGDGMNGGIWKNLVNNKNERYHFLQKIAPHEDAYREGLPELGVDFKRYFTVPSEELHLRLMRNEVRRRCRLRSPYLEHFCSRFHYFQSRVALPADHSSEPE